MLRILSHKNLSTTERYIHNINQDLHAVVNLLSTNGPHMAPIDKKSDPPMTVTSEYRWQFQAASNQVSAVREI
jgi:hypothetical protein